MGKISKFLLTTGIIAASAYVGYQIYKAYKDEWDELKNYDGNTEDDDFDDDFFNKDTINDLKDNKKIFKESVVPDKDVFKLIKRNTLVFGPSGSGKTRNFVETFFKSNIKDNNIIVDINGQLYEKYSKDLEKQGCNVIKIEDVDYDINEIDLRDWVNIFITFKPGEDNSKISEIIFNIFNRIQLIKENIENTVHYNFILNEYCNIGMIKDFSAISAINRKYNVCFFLIAQSFIQFKEYLKYDYQNIAANYPNIIYMGYPLIIETDDELYKIIPKEAFDNLSQDNYIYAEDDGLYLLPKINPDTI